MTDFIKQNILIRTLLTALKASDWSIFISLFVITIPYAYYYYIILVYLHPTEYPDSFAYLWSSKLNLYFLTGRSLTQRFIFMLVQNNPQMIVLVHLGCYLLTAIAIYSLFTVNKSKWVKVLVAVFIATIFSSYTFNLSATMLIAEPIFICLLLLIPCLFFCYHGQYRLWIILMGGILFLLSKNVAPFTLICLIIMLFMTKKVPPKAEIIIYTILVIISIGRIITTNLYDTSLQVNTLNNIYRRVFTSSETNTYFQENYQLPNGPFVKQCQGQWVGVPCLGKNIISVNPESRNYELIADDYGLITWVKTKGQGAYLKYLLFDNIFETGNEYRNQFHYHSKKYTITILMWYLGLEIPTNEPNNLTILTQRNQAEGFLNFDPLLVLHNFLRILGFHHLEIVIGYIIIGFILLQKFKFVSHLPLAITCLATALVLFFLTLFGDAMEITRHILPAYILLILGGVLYISSGLDMALHYRHRLKFLSQ